MKKFLISLLVLFIISFGCQDKKQSEDEIQSDAYENDTEFLVEIEEEPTPIGGINGLASKIEYPQEAKQSGIQGQVFIKAFIDEDGNVVKTEVLKSVGHGLDEAAVRAIMDTKFTPGKINGVPVKVQISIPVKFKLN